jgi:DNA-binding response OmpR family regulator
MRVLIVEEDRTFGEWLGLHVGALWPDAKVELTDLAGFEQGRDIRSRCDRDLVLLSLPFGDAPDDARSAGLEWLRRLRALREFPPIIVIASAGSELSAVRALRLGAVDYLPKRLVTAERLRRAIRLGVRALERRRRPLEKPSPRSSLTPIDAETRIPGYSIRQTLGESDKAVVYLATSEQLGRSVALKVSTQLRGPEDDAARRLFAREYAAINAIHHPAVVDLYDHGVHAGREYLAMEYFPFGDLKARLRYPLSEADALGYLRRIATALSVVHGAGLVHRDLKPPNVMLRESGEVVLIDFGLARGIDDERGSTRTGVLRGSPYYMSPEQARGQPLDGRTDLYSLGVMFYEMLAGAKPFTGSTAIEVLEQHVSAPMPALPPALAHHQWLLERLLAKSVDDRFPSAQAALDAIAGPVSDPVALTG